MTLNTLEEYHAVYILFCIVLSIYHEQFLKHDIL